jgi:hypothetical protein
VVVSLRGFLVRIDGGGTSTDVWVTDVAGRVLGTGFGGPATTTRSVSARPSLRSIPRLIGRGAFEREYFGPRVMQAAIDWLERNGRHDPFFLVVDSFDATSRSTRRRATPKPTTPGTRGNASSGRRTAGTDRGYAHHLHA